MFCNFVFFVFFVNFGVLVNYVNYMNLVNFQCFNSLYAKSHSFSEPVMQHLVNVHCKPYLLYAHIMQANFK